jgi:hypothetical protein
MRVLNTEMVTVDLVGQCYQVRVHMASGQWVVMQDLPGDQQGLVMAMVLATDVLAGKFMPKGVETVVPCVTVGGQEIPMVQGRPGPRLV